MLDAAELPFDASVLRRMRHTAGLSLEAVALAAGLHDKSQLSRMEQGHVVPLATTLGRILQALHPEPALIYALFRLSPSHVDSNRH